MTGTKFSEETTTKGTTSTEETTMTGTTATEETTTVTTFQFSGNLLNLHD
jgi:hypothetical protein